jgi:hypothetical protein
MHCEYTIRAAEAGKHVFCEKPMAISSNECKLMIDACRHAGVKLMIGNRLHHEPVFLKLHQALARGPDHSGYRLQLRHWAGGTRPTQHSYGARLLRTEFCSVLLGQLLFKLALSGQTALPDITQSTSWRFGAKRDVFVLACPWRLLITELFPYELPELYQAGITVQLKEQRSIPYGRGKVDLLHQFLVASIVL